MPYLIRHPGLFSDEFRVVARDDKQNMILQSTITCPYCGHKKTETMPVDSCVFFYECENCKKILKPKEGDCCVFCSYGSVKCPSKQEE